MRRAVGNENLEAPSDFSSECERICHTPLLQEIPVSLKKRMMRFVL
jgi:hypothetical protein